MVWDSGPCGPAGAAAPHRPPWEARTTPTSPYRSTGQMGHLGSPTPQSQPEIVVGPARSLPTSVSRA